MSGSSDVFPILLGTGARRSLDTVDKIGGSGGVLHGFIGIPDVRVVVDAVEPIVLSEAI